MCVIVNLDLAIPATIQYAFSNLKRMSIYNDNDNTLLGLIAISPDNIIEYANRMKSWDLGRVVVNFNSDDALEGLRSYPEFFIPMDGLQMYRLRPQNDNTRLTEDDVKTIIRSLVSNINYSPRVLRTVGLLNNIIR